MKKILAAAAAVSVAFGCTRVADGQSAGTDEMLDYCAVQTERTLAQIGSAGYGMSPRNIAPGDSTWTHDLGFIVFCSYGNGYRLTGNPAYRDVILAAADRLASLYNPAAGTILSWPREVENFGGGTTP